MHFFSTLTIQGASSDLNLLLISSVLGWLIPCLAPIENAFCKITIIWIY